MRGVKLSSRGAIAPVLLLLLLVGLSTCKKHCKKFTTKCPTDYEWVYDEEPDEGDTFTETIHFCCKDVKANPDEACKMTKCFPMNSDDATEEKICSSISTKLSDGKEMGYEMAVRDVNNCKDANGELGVRGLCCPKNSQDGLLTLLMGAEKHQFPHYAMIEIGEKDGGQSLCGGTIYNERYIITASHCFAGSGEVFAVPSTSKIFVDVRLPNKDNPQHYHVEEFIIHPNSTELRTVTGMVRDDVALVKLKKDIKFGPHVKALPLAKPGFNPFKYSNETLIMGVGLTDTDLVSSMLQRGRALLRNVDMDAMNRQLWTDVYEKRPKGSAIFLGGVMNGTSSISAGEGDSGGPAVCRDENGLAVLCGISSTGIKVFDICLESFSEDFCSACTYMAVQYYHDWIVEHAGNQSKAEVLKQPLFGASVETGKYLHQVHITSSGGPSCGGTLIEDDLVVTAAHCVVDDSGNTKGGLKVLSGVRDLNGRQGKKHDVKSVKTLKGFKLGSTGSRHKRLVMLDVKPKPSYPYYKNDLALVKLATKVTIGAGSLPTIGPAPEIDGESDDVEWTTEISLPTNTTMSGALQQREFKILDKKTCQRRVNRAKYVESAVTIDDNVMCGEEKYNGGAQCDRELGGGLICKGSNGKDVLCGVQVFRYCQFALPIAFLDVNRYKKWIEENKSKM